MSGALMESAPAVETVIDGTAHIVSGCLSNVFSL